MYLGNLSTKSKTSERRPNSHCAQWILVIVLSNLITFWVATGSTPWPSVHISGMFPIESPKPKHIPIEGPRQPTNFTALRYVPNAFSAQPGGDIDVDAAWTSIGANYDRFLIPPSEAPSFPELTPSHVFLTNATLPSGPPLPRAGYPVFMEVYHQLHCLNLVRQALHWNWDYYWDSGEGMWGDKKMIRNHIEHCHDYLRLVVMCNSETGVVPFYWYNETGVMLDYRQRKQCGDFGAVQEWAKGHAVDLDGGDVGLRAPEGAVFRRPGT